MKKNILFLILFFCFATVAVSQTKVDSLVKLGREALIKLAVEKINDPAFISTSYDLVTVVANKTTVLVKFELSMNYVSMNACYYDAVTIALAGDGDWKSATGKCADQTTHYYKLTDADKKNIAFVFSAINKSNEIGYFPDNKLPRGTTMTITENEKFYTVDMDDVGTDTHFQVEKVSGKISDIERADFDQAANAGHKDDFVEIK
ncbi:MAG TPA: hypothetical protein VFJ43_05745 [Bacteroidia bacterium]|nr:hypothetical protein [Bacteroidia bacterium]